MLLQCSLSFAAARAFMVKLIQILYPMINEYLVMCMGSAISDLSFYITM